MIKYFKYLIVGVAFGIIMTKSEVISWYRIYEMFRFQSFHMYGVIGSAVAFGALTIAFIKRKKIRTINGTQIIIKPKKRGWQRYLYGGTIFGFGWVLTGACPGPMFTLLGNGFLVMLVVIASATLGTYIYGLVKESLPH